ncbi:MAG: membrane-bound lytic murein transglycosylase MltF [Nitrosomonadales bacterium]
MVSSPHLNFILLVCWGSFLFIGCTPSEQSAKPWREELTIAVAQGDNSVDMEFEQQLIALFAKQLKVKTKLLSLPPENITPALMTGRAHFAAAGLRSNESGGLHFAPSYQTVNEQAVCTDPPRGLKGLIGKKIAVAADSAQEAALHEVQQKMPALHWDTRYQQTVANLLAEVAAGKLDCTIANEEQLALAKNYYPKLEAALNIGTPSKLAWAFAPEGDEALFAEAQMFFAGIKQDGTLRRLLDRYYGHNERLEPIDAVTFITKTQTELPRLRPLFEEAGTVTGIDWQLLAAIGYHESHWNPLATSFTNVRGIMMLTEETADRMKVTDRLDPRQSILAGASYLQLIKDQLPQRIADEERTWLALAAYNQGLGHLEDARVLAAQNGLNADSWSDVKKMMPLLAQPEYFEKTKHGYARGGEAVVLVETVHLYYDMLRHMDTREIPSLPASPFQLKLPGGLNLNLP